MAFIIAAIPFFFLLIAIELVVDKIRKTGYYQFNDAVNSLNLGVFSRVTGILKAMLPLSVYVWLYQEHRIVDIPNDHWAVWIFAFVVYDLGYYWVHRLSHRVSIMWASHVVHHSSEEFNLTTALRQTSTPALFAWVIYLPMAVIGVSPELAVACGSLNLIYQFWVHTRHVDRMPDWYEAIFVTPSNHRVHHALNGPYIDKNYGGVFILWDKLFNSFEDERADVKIVYGVSYQLNSWNPIWANLQVYKNILIDAWRTKRWIDKIKTIFMPPGFRAEDLKQDYPRKYANSKTLIKYDVALSTTMKAYVLIQFALVIALTFAYILHVGNLTLAQNFAVCGLVMYHCWGISTLQEAKRYSGVVETLRLLSSSIALYYFVGNHTVFALMLGINAISGAWFYLAKSNSEGELPSTSP